MGTVPSCAAPCPGVVGKVFFSYRAVAVQAGNVREPVHVVVVVGVWLVAEVVADVPVGSETADSALGDVSDAA
jgi:hypothetical protein